METVLKCIEKANSDDPKLMKSIKTIGITNQRETTIVWDKITGKPLHHALGN